MKLLIGMMLSLGSLNCSLAQSTPDWTISIEPAKKIRANYPAPMRINLSDVSGQPVTAASVEFVLNMIDMDHGEHKTPAVMVAPGVYEGTVKFFMVGAWSFDVRVTKGNYAQAKKFRFDVND